MRIYIKQGWRLTVNHIYLVLLLFLYQLLWGVVIYRSIDSIVAPLLRRFPSDYPSETAVSHFLAEAQFLLFKTNLISPYLWMLGGLLLARMLLSPLINAGLIHSMLHQTRAEGSGTRFLEGIRRNWRAFLLLYWGESALALMPGIWLLPQAVQTIKQSGSLALLIQKILPSSGLWILWIIVLHLLFLAMQFGAAAGDKLLASLWRGMRHFALFTILTLLMWGIGVAIGLVSTSISMLWAGLYALILHQGFHFFRSLLKVWTLAVQFEYLQSK